MTEGFVSFVFSKTHNTMEEMKLSIIKHCKQILLENPDNWAVLEYMFGYEYNLSFEQHFGTILTVPRVDKLLFAGKNLAHAVRAYQETEECPLDNLLLFIEKFVMIQFENSNFQEDYEPY